MPENIAAFPLYQLNDIPAALRQLAHKIENGDIPAERCVVCIDGGLEAGMDYKAFGAEPFTRGHAAGLCFGVAVMLSKED